MSTGLSTVASEDVDIEDVYDENNVPRPTSSKPSAANSQLTANTVVSGDIFKSVVKLFVVRWYETFNETLNETLCFFYKLITYI